MNTPARPMQHEYRATRYFFGPSVAAARGPLVLRHRNT